MKKKVLLLSAAAAAFSILCLTGCGERVEEAVTEAVTEVSVQTEAITEIQIETQPVTEIVTEPPTEPPTQPPTEPPTEPDVDLPPEEEMAQEEYLAAPVTYYASDATNIRDTPSTENTDNIISSYEQGDEVTVVAKTPHWYKVSRIDSESGDEYSGYVYKKYISETGVNPATDEDIAAANIETAVETPAPAPAEAPAEQSAPAAPVSGYENSFPIVIAQDANIRSDASEVAEVVGVINAGTQVTAIGETGNWYQVDYNGIVGFVSRSLVG